MKAIITLLTTTLTTAMIGATTLMPQAVSAAEFVVDTQTDAVDNNLADGHCITAANQCSLRAAIQQSNALAGRDTIQLPAGTYTLSIAGNNEDAGASGDLDVNDGLSIIGTGSSQTIIDAAQLDRVMDIRGAHFLTLQGISFINGKIEGGLGGGILILGSISSTQVDQRILLNDITLSNNIALNGIGGGLYNGSNQPITIEDSLINDNQADSGGGLSSTNYLSLLRTQVANNATTGSAAGLGLLNGGYLFNNTIENNQSEKSAGGIDAGDHVVIQGGTLRNNQSGKNGAIGFAGGIRLNDLSITGDQSGYFYLGDVNIAENSATRNGGGLYASFSPATPKKVLLVRLTVQNNRSTASGGGISLNQVDLIADSLFTDNQSANDGGAIKLTKLANSPAITHITRSAFIENSAKNDGLGELINACGGALSLTDGHYQIDNSTFSGNRAETLAVGGTSRGGALCVLNSFNNTFELSQSTLVDNFTNTAEGSGNLFLTITGSANLLGNIIHSPRSGVNCKVSAKVTSDGYNIGGDSSCGLSAATDLITSDAVTLPLGDNGGGTQTHALTAASAALDYLPQNQCLSIDQRGFSRAGTNCDAGAHEQNALTLTIGHALFSASDYTVNESEGSIDIVLQRREGTEGALSIELVSWPDTADIDRSNSTNPVLDFDDTAHTVTWADNDTADKTVTLSIDDDTEYEGNETFTLRILPLNGQDKGVADNSPIQATVTITDNDPPAIPEFNFDVSSIDVSERQAGLFVTVERNITRVKDAVDIHYAITGGSALANSDYTLSDGSLHFEAGESKKALIIPLIDDNTEEPSENIQISLVAKNANVALSALKPTTVTVNILDNDAGALPKPTNVGFNLASEQIAENAGSLALTVNRTGLTDSATTVEFLLGAGTAKLDTDFSLTPALLSGVGTLTFGIGETSQTITLTALDDNISEQTETVNLLLRSTDANVGIGTIESMTITLLDDDAAATNDGIFNFDVPALSQDESTPSFSVTINRTGNTGAPTDIELRLNVSGTAENGSDYTYQNIPIVFSQNTVSKLFSISVLDDVINEPDETIILSISQVSGNGIVGPESSVELTIIDNDSTSQAPGKDTGSGSGAFGIYLTIFLLLILAGRTGMPRLRNVPNRIS